MLLKQPYIGPKNIIFKVISVISVVIPVISVSRRTACFVHTVNDFHCFVIIKRMYAFVSENHMLDWHSCQICYPLEIKLLLADGGR